MTNHTYLAGDNERAGKILQRFAHRTLRAHWQRFVAEGVILFLVGAAAVIAPNVATLATAVLIGWMVVIAGLYGIASAIATHAAPGFASSLALSIATTILGGLLVVQPFTAVLTLTMALIAYFVIHGFAMLALTTSMISQSRNWMWLVFAAIVDFCLAAIVISGWPGTATWTIGLLLGINLMFSGIGLAFAAIGAHAETDPPKSSTPTS